MLTVDFAALTQGLVSTLSFCFLMKLGVYCQMKRQNKLEKKHLPYFTDRTSKQKDDLLSQGKNTAAILVD